MIHVYTNTVMRCTSYTQNIYSEGSFPGARVTYCTAREEERNKISRQCIIQNIVAPFNTKYEAI